MLRLTTALCYSSGPVAYRRVDARSEPRELAMPRGEQRYRLTPAVGRKSAEDVHRRLSEARALAEGDGFTTTTEGDAALPGFIVSAMLHEPFRRACAKIGVAPSTWRTRMPWPVPTGSLLAFLGRHDEVVVIEEMEPLLEEQATLLAYRERLTTRIEGVDLRRRFGRLDGEDIEEILCKRLGRKASRGRSLATNVAPRPPTFCAGCPHTASFYSLKQVLESEPSRPFVASDIGCYTLGTKKGIDVGDVVLCMGASIGIATGAALAGERSIALIGDSTFLHAGLPALKNAVDQGVDLLVCVLDNGVAAMTGGQSTAESALAGGPALATAFSAAHVDVADPFDVVDLTAKVRRLLAAKGVTVLFVRSPCALERAPQPRRPRVDVDLCTGCGDCTTKIHCPAITLDENRKFRVDVTTCIGCGFCSEICPEGALTPVPYP